MFPRARHPLKPFGQAANEAANTVDGTLPIMSMLGDQMVDSQQDLVKDAGRSVAKTVAPMLGKALTGVASSGTMASPGMQWAAPLVGAAGTALSNASPEMIEGFANMTPLALKAAGRAGMGALSKGLRGAGRFMGDKPDNPQTEQANFARAMMATAPVMKPMGGAPPPLPSSPALETGPSGSIPEPTIQGSIQDRLRRFSRSPERL